MIDMIDMIHVIHAIHAINLSNNLKRWTLSFFLQKRVPNHSSKDSVIKCLFDVTKCRGTQRINIGQDPRRKRCVDLADIAAIEVN